MQKRYRLHCTLKVELDPEQVEHDRFDPHQLIRHVFTLARTRAEELVQGGDSDAFDAGLITNSSLEHVEGMPLDETEDCDA